MSEHSILQIFHISHHHPLQPKINPNAKTSCSGCRLEPSETMYNCEPCDFTLHRACIINLQEKLSHPSHVGCTQLSLDNVLSRTYVTCDACSEQIQINEWMYSCRSCDYDLHLSCAFKPPQIEHQNHKCSGKLNLSFTNPYGEGNPVVCNICFAIRSSLKGYKNWMYHCSLCNFDVHLGCVNKEAMASSLGSAVVKKAAKKSVKVGLNLAGLNWQ